MNPNRDSTAYWFQLKSIYTRDKREITAYLEDIDRLNMPVPHTPDIALLRWTYDRLQDGVLAESGGVNQQPAHYVDDMRFVSMMDYFVDLDRLIGECDDEMQRIAQDAYDKRN